ncbi:hypothetical protein [Micromonospora sp. DT229]
MNTPNINVELPSGTEIRLQVAVRAGDTTRRVSYGDLTRVSMVLFRLPS